MQRKKVLILSFFPAFYPPRSGGELRLYNIYKNLSKYYNITILSFTYPGSGEKYQKYTLSPDLVEIRIPKSKIHDLLHHVFYKYGHIIESSGIVVSIASHFIKNYKNILNKLIEDADIIISTHPYLYKRVSHKFVIYESYNMEYYLQNKALGSSTIAKILSGYVFHIEKNACLSSDMVFAVSEEDRNDFYRVYNVPLNKIFLAPNGVDLKEIMGSTVSEKDMYKSKLNLNSNKTLLFIGSAHPPNVDAARIIIEDIAPSMPEFTFLIAGKVSDYFFSNRNEVNEMKVVRSNIPNNVKILGLVDEETKKTLLKASDAALNPQTYGSGTNLKMLEYLAAGLPIITTPIGARGINIINNTHAIICEVKEFKTNIFKLVENETFYQKLIKNGKKLAEEMYDWTIIAEKMHEDIEMCYEKKNGSCK